MSNTKPHEQRVLAEKAELDAKLKKLGEFIDAPSFDSLPQLDRALLMEQLICMGEYSGVLGRRIARFAT